MPLSPDDMRVVTVALRHTTFGEDSTWRADFVFWPPTDLGRHTHEHARLQAGWCTILRVLTHPAGVEAAGRPGINDRPFQVCIWVCVGVGAAVYAYEGLNSRQSVCVHAHALCCAGTNALVHKLHHARHPKGIVTVSITSLSFFAFWS